MRLGPGSEPLDDVVHHVGRLAAVRVDLEARDVVVEGRPGGHQLTDARERVGGLEQRALVPARPPVDRFGGCLEDHDRAARAEQATILLAHDGAAAGRDDDLVEVEAAAHDLGLVVAEGLLAVELEDLADAHAGDPLDHPVGVDEGQLQPPRQLPADAALAGAHEAGHGDPGDGPIGEVAPCHGQYAAT